MILELQNVRCGYGKKVVVDGFSAKVSSGDIFCLLGPNGVGKTTLFKTILGLLPLLGGSITCDGENILNASPKEYAKLIGYVPQAHTPPFAFTVFDVVVMGRTIHQGILGRPGKKDYAFAMEVMERLGILFLRDRVYTELSGGERQMVIIARALTQEPAFLIMDEPTANLDFGNQAKVLTNVKKLAREGLGIIMTTHSPNQVFQCDADVALLKSNNEFIYGKAHEVLLENTLFDAYGIPVAVAKIDYRNNTLHVCQSLLDEKHD